MCKISLEACILDDTTNANGNYQQWEVVTVRFIANLFLDGVTKNVNNKFQYIIGHNLYVQYPTLVTGLTTYMKYESRRSTQFTKIENYVFKKYYHVRQITSSKYRRQIKVYICLWVLLFSRHPR